eukprot:SAG11_NODE_302_length_11005_cov_12.491748_6_plen_73_part_00
MLRVLTALASMSKAIPFFGTFISARIMSRAEPIKRMLETQQKEYKLLVPLVSGKVVHMATCDLWMVHLAKFD